MIGIVLAGGLGTRLMPLTRCINKHLLPVGPEPMIFYPLRKLAEAGIKRVMIVVGGKSTGDILNTVRDGKEFGFDSVAYAFQEGEGGIAMALACAKGWANEDMVVILGDNVFTFDLRKVIDDFTGSCNLGHVVLTKVSDPRAYGVPEFNECKSIKYIMEKPKHPKSNYAVTGIYVYAERIFDEIPNLKASQRGEFEISDLNNLCIPKLGYTVVPRNSWFDAGSSFDALLKGSIFVSKKSKRCGGRSR